MKPMQDAFQDAMNITIQDTIDLIKELHKGQVDKLGAPYETHPQRVADNVKKIYPDYTDDMIKAALLHDTIEDCGIDEQYLLNKGYSQECVGMVVLLTKPEDDTRAYDAVIDDLIASGNKGAMVIKMSDNMDNLKPDRVAKLRASNPERAEELSSRYWKSIEKLAAATGLDIDVIRNTIEETPSLDGEQKEQKMGQLKMAFKNEAENDRTIDHETGAYLVYEGGVNHPGMHRFSFHWQGETMDFFAEREDRNPESSVWDPNIHWNFFQVAIPHNMQDQRDEIVDMIKQALEVHAFGYEREPYDEVTAKFIPPKPLK